jgi:dTDP-4-amino-4,6-dideoxy-D-galactose acyltransferase
VSDLLELLPWDTEFFGLKIGRVLPSTLDRRSLAEIIHLAEEGKFDCLYFQANPEDEATVELAEGGGFHLVDVRILLEHPFDGRPAPVPRYSTPGDIRLAPARHGDRPALEEIAVETGHTSRFYFDRRFPPDACPRLYRAWLNKAMDDERGLVLVASLEDRPGPPGMERAEPLGLIACGVEGAPSRLGPSGTGIGVIRLAGVKSGRRGRGVGTALVQGALDWFRAQGLRGAEVTTQARNVPAQRLYQQMGFFTRRMTLYYHRWTEKLSPSHGTQTGGTMEGQEERQQP